MTSPIVGQIFFWDAKTPGLGIRITKNGVKSYIVQTRLHGKTLRLTIGLAQVWSIDKAQAEARRLIVLIDQGIDPRIERLKLKTLILSQCLINQPALIAWNIYIKENEIHWSKRYFQDHIDLSRNGGEPITKGLRKNQPAIKEIGFLRPLLNLPFPQLTRDKVIEWIQSEVVARPVKTHLALVMFRTFIRWAITKQTYKHLIQKDLCNQIGKRVPKPKAKKDCLQKEQLKTWFNVIQKIPNITISAYLQSLLLTGARRGELASLKWENIDFNWHTIAIKDKINKTRLIPLTPYVESLIVSLPKINEFIFSSKRAENGYIREPRIAHNLALKNSALPHLTIHGLRRSFGTLSEWVECPIGISAQIMGHAPSAIAEKHYRQRPIDLLRKWHIQIESFILQEAEININNKT